MDDRRGAGGNRPPTAADGGSLDSGDPATHPRADYDYTGGETAWQEFVADLDAAIDGSVRFDEYTRSLYATDASAYEVTPIGVVLPRHTADVATTVGFCAEWGVPVLPRGGGTSLAGQAVNEAVVLDFTRHMDAIREISPGDRTATAQPGVVLAELNEALADDGLKFAPDPAWGDKSALGGAIGNNSTGSHSLQYGKTDAYIESVEAVLADGTVTRFGDVTLEALRDRADPDGDLEGRIHHAVARIVDEEADAVRAAYPELQRNVSGYNLDRLVEEAAETGRVNLARLLAGSEGTLAIVTEATIALEPVPETTAVALLCYESLGDALADVGPVLAHDPAAVEVLDDVLLGLARETAAFGDLVREILPDGTAAVLLVEFYAADDAAGRTQVADLLADRLDGQPTDGAAVRAVAAREAYDPATQERFWTLRKSGLPILLGRTSDAKHVSFIEDVAVPPAALPAFVDEFQTILDDHGTFASFYGHAGPGCLHVRPLIDTKTDAGLEQMAGIADAVTDLVVEYEGSVSGEHGDGRARTQWNRRLYGDDLWAVFRRLKSAFDPDWLLNPGQVCGDVHLTEDLRFDPAYEFEASFEPVLEWADPNGFQGMTELCHGCGGCRGAQATTGGVMCPTYRAADEEIQSTRGRANMLRRAMSGQVPADPTDAAFRDEVLDLCIGCKGCARDCPSEVDLAKLKAEVDHAAHQREGASRRDRLFRDIDRLARLGSRLAPVSNVLPRVPGARWLLDRTLGIAPERSLPAFSRQSFEAWFAARDDGVSPTAADRHVALLPDPFANYVTPGVAKAAVTVLELAGVHVSVPDTPPSGRAAYSTGFLDVASERARGNVTVLAPLVADGWDVVAVEPSEAVVRQAEYRDLLADTDADRVADNTYGVCGYFEATGLAETLPFDAPDEHLAYHGHCHQKASGTDGHAVRVLRRAGYAVDPIDSTCCGMAGAFGYEAEHYSMSRAIGRLLFDQVAESEADAVVAPGASCRTQLGDRAGHERPAHPIEKLAAALD